MLFEKNETDKLAGCRATGASSASNGCSEKSLLLSLAPFPCMSRKKTEQDLLGSLQFRHDSLEAWAVPRCTQKEARGGGAERNYQMA